jgi:DNA-binding CsgD family transcriptional regulator
LVFLTVFAALTCFFSLLLGFLVFRKDKTSHVKKLFLFLALLLGLWAVASIFLYSAETHPLFVRWFKIGYLFQLLYIGAFLHFTLAVTGRLPKRRLSLFLMYLPCIISIILIQFDQDYWSGFTRVDNTWHFNQQLISIQFISFLIIWLIYYVSSAVLFFQKAGTVATVPERNKFLILGFSIVGVIIGISLEVMILPGIFGFPSRGADIVIKFGWLLCVGFVIDRYQFLIAPNQIEEIALTEFPGFSVFVLDTEQNIVRVNREAEKLFSSKQRKLLGTPFGSILKDEKRLEEELEFLKQQRNEDISCVAELRDGTVRNCCLDLKISILKNQSGSHLGFIAIGKLIKSDRHIKQEFNLSRRELEVVENIIEGKTNQEIAELLSISEKTVKTHVTHIFNKTGVENRIQLFNILRENHFISQHSSDKDIILLD